MSLTRYSCERCHDCGQGLTWMEIAFGSAVDPVCGACIQKRRQTTYATDPYAPRCRDGQGNPCPKPGRFRLLDPEGNTVPGCFMCQGHAVECTREYAQKLNEHWTIYDPQTGERA